MAQALLNQWPRPPPPQAHMQQAAASLHQDVIPAAGADTSNDSLLNEIWGEMEKAQAVTSTSQPRPKTQLSKRGKALQRQLKKRSGNSTHGRSSNSHSSAQSKKSIRKTHAPSSSKEGRQLSKSSDLLKTMSTAPNSKPPATTSLPLSNLPLTMTLDPLAFLTQGFDSLMLQLFPAAPPLELTARISLYKPLFLELITPHLSPSSSTALSDLVTLFLNAMRSLQLI